MLSIISPAFNESKNLPLLHQRLSQVLDKEWEWIVVDDHSTDDTFHVLRKLAMEDAHVRAFRLTRNFGSHGAILCGLEHAAGDAAVVLASDLQDPPEVIPLLLDEWQKGAQVVWAARRKRQGESMGTLGFSRLYYLIMRKFVGIKMPPLGADFFLIDRRVIQALTQFSDRNTNWFALIMWLGFEQATVEYSKLAREYGKSGWSLEKKFKLLIDSITSFTYAPIRLMSYTGFIVSVCGFIYATITLLNGVLGHPPEGWASLMVVTLIIGGMQMLMLGVLGEYLWRTFDETRQRPRYLVEASTVSLNAAE